MKNSPPPKGHVTEDNLKWMFHAGWIEVVPDNPTELICYTPEGEIAAKLLGRFLLEAGTNLSDSHRELLLEMFRTEF